jgi:hypothetical protein
MKTTVITREQLNGNGSVQNAPKSGVEKNVKGNEVANGKKAVEEEKKPLNSVPVAPIVEAPKAEQPIVSEPAKDTPQPKSEPTKMEIKEQLKEEKPLLNLDSTIKLIETLHRRKIQRDKLLGTIDTLEAFEVAQLEDADETDTNKFQRCELSIEDDKGNEFNTKNPFIINAVAQYVNRLCVDKLAEIEGGITLPA